MNLTIYIDVLFLLNFILDYIILVTTAFLNDVKPKLYRIICASAIGALYSVLIFFPQLSLINILLFRIGISIIIVLTAFKYLAIINYIKNVLTYYIVNAIYGGSIYAFYNFTVLGSKMNYSNGVYYIDLPLWAILALTFLMYWLIKFVTVIFNNRTQSKNIRTIKIIFSEETLFVNALFDTGNSLCDPISLLPVMLVQSNCFENKLQAGIIKEIQKQSTDSLLILHKIYPELKFRMIPFKDISGNKSTVFAFKPTKVVDLEKNKEMPNILIGIINTQLCNDKSYEALLNSKL